MIDLRMKRVQWALGGALLLLAGLLMAVFNHRRCEVVIYNEAAFERSGLVVTGGGESWMVEPLHAEGSRQHRVAVDTAGETWGVHLRAGAAPLGETWFEPGPGRRLIVRIWPDDSVEFQVLGAWWE